MLKTIVLLSVLTGGAARARELGDEVGRPPTESQVSAGCDVSGRDAAPACAMTFVGGLLLCSAALLWRWRPLRRAEPHPIALVLRGA